ncbi:MAG: molybdenum cofactor guanylyltransferase [Micavibrio sp.]|nr:MAG: molybdenum cofactor guanylyltransferase [Micavibrio sp.]
MPRRRTGRIATDRIAGIVLAGGKSSRMGENKALLRYGDATLLDHMITQLQKTGISEIFVSGEYDGYRCIPDAPDTEKFAGPAVAIRNILQQLQQAEAETAFDFDGAVFVPVDMPLLSPEALDYLLQYEDGAYFAGQPLPACFPLPAVTDGAAKSMRGLLRENNITEKELPQQFFRDMLNANTPEEWKEAVRNECKN